MVFTCEYCGKSFQNFFSNRRYKHIYCSQVCSGNAFIKTREKRFWEKVEKSDGCWSWRGGKTGAGYGEFCKQLAHRFSYKLANGKIPYGKFVLHSCDNPACVNPKHLRVGTQRDNIRDASRKHRINHGEDRPQHKLTETQVLEIRSIYSAGNISQVELAKKYKVSERNIFNIVHRFRWKHI